MKIFRLAFIILTGLMLSACGRSPDSQFYVLNPITAHPMQMKNYRHLRIGINEIQGPTYFSKPQFVIHYSVQEVKLEEFHRWIGDLGKNVKQVIEVNLKTLLPGVALVSAPWEPKFNPAYQLGIDILRFEVDINGNSDLSVDYIVYNDKKLYKKGTLVYHKKVVPPEVDNLVASMNENLNQFTRDLAKVLSSLN